MKYVTTAGQIIELTIRPIGRGGEGEVSPVAGKLGLAAKIFHHPTKEHRAKLEFMVANPVSQCRDHFWVTWPRDILFTKDSKPKFAGYIMPKLTHAQPLFTCYNSVLRQKQHSHFDYRHLVRSARNLAAAFSLAHAHHLVIGDSNESNVFVTEDARVILIDSDSWQIIDRIHRRTYHSLVAKTDFLPPELQNRSLKNLDRQPSHDNFALAVLIFKLLGEGCHPCDGVFLDAADVPPVEARIAAGIFPFLDKFSHWRPKGLALPFNSLHPRLQKLFLQAFEAGHARPQLRPSASEWQEAITTAESELRRCRQNSRHCFWGNQCIWCQRKQLLGGQDPFPGGKPRANSRSPTAARKVSPPAPIRKTESKIRLAWASPKKPKFVISEFDKFLIITLGIMLAISGLMLLAKVVMLVAQKLN